MSRKSRAKGQITEIRLAATKPTAAPSVTVPSPVQEPEPATVTRRFYAVPKTDEEAFGLFREVAWNIEDTIKHLATSPYGATGQEG